MARFLVLWRMNLAAPWPTDPAELPKLAEKMWAVQDDLLKKGEVKEFGFFLDGTSGYTIDEGEAIDTFRSNCMFVPYSEFEVHEIIPYEKGNMESTLESPSRSSKEVVALRYAY